MVDTVSLENTEAPVTVSIDPGNTSPTLPANVIANRATKYAFGLENLKYTTEQIQEALAGGEEDKLRTKVASDVNVEKSGELQKKINDILKVRPLTPDEIMKISEDRQPANPEHVLESTYADKFFAGMYPDPGEFKDWQSQAMNIAPQLYDDTVILGKSMLTKEELIRKDLEDFEAMNQNQSTGSWLWNTAKAWTIPLRNEYSLRGVVPVEGWHLLGNNLSEQSINLFGMPIEQFNEFRKRIKDTFKSDPEQGKAFLTAILGQTTGEKFLNNWFSTIDAANVAGAGKGLFKAIRSLNAMRRAPQELLKASERVAEGQSPKVVAAETMGDLGTAANENFTDAAKRELGLKKTGTNTNLEVSQELSSAINGLATDIKQGPGRGGQELANQMAESTEWFGNRFKNLVQFIMKAERIPEPVMALPEVAAGIKSWAKSRYTGLENQVLDVTNPVFDRTTNRWYVDVHFGRPGAEFFERPGEALTFADQAGFWDPRAKLLQDVGPTLQDIVTRDNLASGWYIRKRIPIDEKLGVIRDALVKLESSETPVSWPDQFFKGIAKWRTPDETVSFDQRLARKVATYAPNAFFKLAQETAEDIRQLAKRTLPFTQRKQDWEDWNKVLKLTSSLPDPDNPERLGIFLKNPAEYEDHFFRTIGHFPNEAQTKAYFSYTRLMEMDRMFRNLQLYKLMSRNGAETHRVFYHTKDGEKVLSPDFAGTVRKDLPLNINPENADTIAVINSAGKVSLWRDHIPTKTWEKYNELIKNGKAKLIEVYDAEQRPLNGFSKIEGQRIRYVIASNVETEELKFDQIPRRGGPHVEYDAPMYLKQPRIRPETIRGITQHWYEGDSTLAPITSRRMGEDLAKRMNNFMKILKESEADARVWWENQPVVGLPFEEVKSWFYPQRGPGPGGIVPARFSWDHDFKVVPSDRMIIDIDKELENSAKYKVWDETKKEYRSTFRDGTKTGSMARESQIEYTGMRDSWEVHTVQDEGRRYNPVYRWMKADTVDPMPSLYRGLSKIVHSYFMDDFKVGAIESWLQEAKPLMNIEDKRIMAAPYYYFMQQPSWKKAALEVPETAQQIARLEANWFKIKQFAGIQSKQDTFMTAVAQNLADSVYEKFGPTSKVTILSQWAMAHTTDPWAFIRSAVFNAKMGLFNIPQVVVQMASFVNIMGISGVQHAGPGAMGTLLYGWARLNRNPAIMDTLDGLMTKMGFLKSGEFKEAVELGQNSGFFHVLGEYALKDDVTSPKIVSVGIDRVLHAGQMPFNIGETTHRLNSWFTAYHEFRATNPTGKISNRDAAIILERADILSNNMSRASTSLVHTGALSIPMQFYTYFLRLTELMTGKRLTFAEKARLFGTNALVYGVPAAAPLVAFGIPLENPMKNLAEDHLGYVGGSNFWSSTLMEGGLSAIGALITGGFDKKQQHWYNFGTRYGPSGMPTFAELFNQVSNDESTWKIILHMVGGATYSTVANTTAASGNLAYGLYDAMRAYVTGDQSKYPIKPADFIDAFREIQTVNSADRWWKAINTQKWFSRHGIPMGEGISPWNATFMTLTGATDIQLSNVFRQSMSLRRQQAMWRDAERNFLQQYQRSHEAYQNNDPVSAQDYIQRAIRELVMADYPNERTPGLWARASKSLSEGKTMQERVLQGKFLRNAPQSRRPQDLKTYQEYKSTGQIH